MGCLQGKFRLAVTQVHGAAFAPATMAAHRDMLFRVTLAPGAGQVDILTGGLHDHEPIVLKRLLINDFLELDADFLRAYPDDFSDDARVVFLFGKRNRKGDCLPKV